MTTNVLNFGHGSLVLGGTDHICQIQSAMLVASNTRQDIATACGTSSSFIQESFDFRIRFLQDWASGGISRYLWDHYNQQVAFTFSPDPDGTPGVAGNLTCPRPSLGGDALTPLVDDVACPVVGTPTISSDV